MVVNPTENGWECIYQRAHAWMSYLTLLDLKSELRSDEWSAVLQATLTHDHGWMEWDEALIDEQGRPQSFVVSDVAKGIKISQRAVDLTAYQSLRSAVFVARHVEELYGWRPEPELARHVERVRERRHEWMSRLQLTDEVVEQSYQLVLWADSLSLMLCVEDREFVDSLELVLGETVYRLNGSGEEWRLAPWPYQTDLIRVSVETRLLQQRTFRSSADLRAALSHSEIGFRHWTVRP